MYRFNLATVIVLLSTVFVTLSTPAAEELERPVWAESLPAGAVRAVFLAPYGAHVDTHELMLRFPIDAIVVPVTGPYNVREFGIPGHYWSDLCSTARRVLHKVREALATDWEVVVMCGFPEWKDYPEDIRRSIIDGVSQGKALVAPGLGSGLEADMRNAGIEPKEVNGGDGAPQTYRCGKGRVVCFSASNDNRFGYLLSKSPLQADFELSVAVAGKVLVQAARPKSTNWLHTAVYEEGQLRVAVGNHKLLRGTKMRVRVRRCDTYDHMAERTRTLRSGEDAVIPLPPLAGGEYQAEVILTDPDGVTIDWLAERFAVESPVSLTSVTPKPEVVREGQPLSLELAAEGRVNGLSTSIRWYDAWARLLEETRPVPFGKSYALTAPKGSASVLNRIEVTLLKGSAPVAVASCEVIMPEKTPADDFYVLYWNTGLRDTWRARLQYEALRLLGAADAFSNTPRSRGVARAAALANLRVAPYTTAFHKIGLGNALLSEEWLGNMEKQARETAQAQRDYRPLAYTLGDENYMDAFRAVGRFADSPEAWALFGRVLKEVYPTLDALNAQWGTAFTDWGEIRFSSEREMLRSFANPSAWVDYRMFVSRAYAAAHHRMRDAIREEDPGAWVGFDGAEQYSSYDGYDWWQLAHGMDCVNVYHAYLLPRWLPKIFNGEAVRSFAPDAPLSGCWLNSADRRYGGSYVPWYLCLNGWNSVWWWHATFPHPANGGLTWDLKPTPIVADMAESVRKIEQGPAAMLAHAERLVDPIAVHYSENNWHASTIESGVGNHANNLGHSQMLWMANSLTGRYVSDDEEQRAIWGDTAPNGHYAVAAGNVHLLLRDLGFQARTLARQEIEAGELDASNTRVLFLPFAVSLSDAEVTAIRAFVEGGGLAIADYRCGTRDLHGRVRGTPALDEVFGIKRDGLDVLRERAVASLDYRDIQGARLESVFHERIAADGARVYGFHDDGTPAFLVHGFGEGTTVYMNTDLYAYDELRRRGDERDIRELFRALLVREADLFAPFPVAHFRGHPVPHTEVTRFRDGNTLYYGILRDYTTDDKSIFSVSLPFPIGKHIYRVDTRSLVNPGPIPLEPGSAQMYAVMPYPVNLVQLEGPAEAHRGCEVEMTLQILSGAGVKMGGHVVCVDVTRCDGVKPEHLQQTLYLERGSGSFTFTPARNAPQGKWQVEATEAVSGKKATAAVVVR